MNCLVSLYTTPIPVPSYTRDNEERHSGGVEASSDDGQRLEVLGKLKALTQCVHGTSLFRPTIAIAVDVLDTNEDLKR